eukprot:GDKJ01032768.1.p1 GENE.GDKJ01032768.1~~GDKJ01032768.1.p1  ORF type:complete len:253 (+),score=26.45 GDKJ01032768.1:78-836(+)
MSDNIREEATEIRNKVSDAAAADGLVDSKASPHLFNAAADGAVMVISSLTFGFYFTSCENCYFYLWYLLALLLVGKGIAGLVADNAMADPAGIPKKLLGSLNGVHSILGALIVFFAPLPSVFIIASMLLLSAVDLVSAQRPVLRQHIPQFEEKGGAFFDKVSQHHIDSLKVVSAALELLAVFTVLFCGGFLFWVGYVAFLLLRFRCDRQVRHMWKIIGGGADQVALHPSMPPLVGQNYKTAKDGLYKAATSF